MKQHSLVGSYGRNRDDIVNLLKWVSEGKVKAAMQETFPLATATNAFKLLRDRQVLGKVVIVP